MPLTRVGDQGAAAGWCRKRHVEHFVNPDMDLALPGGRLHGGRGDGPEVEAAWRGNLAGRAALARTSTVSRPGLPPASRRARASPGGASSAFFSTTVTLLPLAVNAHGRGQRCSAPLGMRDGVIGL